MTLLGESSCPTGVCRRGFDPSIFRKIVREAAMDFHKNPLLYVLLTLGKSTYDPCARVF